MEDKCDVTTEKFHKLCEVNTYTMQNIFGVKQDNKLFNTNLMEYFNTKQGGRNVQTHGFLPPNVEEGGHNIICPLSEQWPNI